MKQNQNPQERSRLAASSYHWVRSGS